MNKTAGPGEEPLGSTWEDCSRGCENGWLEYSGPLGCGCVLLVCVFMVVPFKGKLLIPTEVTPAGRGQEARGKRLLVLLHHQPATHKAWRGGRQAAALWVRYSPLTRSYFWARRVACSLFPLPDGPHRSTLGVNGALHLWPVWT